MALKLPRLPSGFRIINPDGTPTNEFQIWWSQFARRIEDSVNGLEAALEAAGIALAAAEVALDAADAANTAAADAQTAVDAQSSEASIVNSGVINEVGSLTANASGTITITNHDRLYGNSTLNPTVAVTGDTLPTAYVPGDVVYIYYDDPTRAGGAVTYQASDDPADAVQGGNRHSVGVVTVPPASTQAGSYVRPAGIIPS